LTVLLASSLIAGSSISAVAPMQL